MPRSLVLGRWILHTSRDGAGACPVGAPPPSMACGDSHGAHFHVAEGARPRGSWRDFGVGVACEIFMIGTLGQPLDVLKTHAALNGRGEPLWRCALDVYRAGGVRGLYAGLYPWALLESLTGGCLVVGYNAAHDALRAALHRRNAARARDAAEGLSPWAVYMVSHTVGGMAGGACQGLSLFPIFRMKVAEMSREGGGRGALAFCRGALREHGMRFLFKGAHIFVLRQVSSWGSRIGMSKFVQERICEQRQREGATRGTACRLHTSDVIAASLAGGAFACWNHPIEVVNIRVQAMRGGSGGVGAPAGLVCAAREVYAQSGARGFARGLQTRLLLSSWATLCMVGMTDYLRDLQM